MSARGHCLYCGATAVFELGLGGARARLVWTSAGGSSEEPWDFGSVAPVCPPCWGDVLAERAARAALFAANGGRVVAAEDVERFLAGSERS